MKIMVISLGGSLIVPDKIDFKFLKKFKTILRKHYKKWKFIVVCGGGSIARKYISILQHDSQKRNNKELSLAGIRATRMNALTMMQFFGKEANDTLPMSIKAVIDNLQKNNIVICGALRYTPNSTSDGTSARLAKQLNSEFINITNIKGLYTDNPLTNKNAKFIAKINWKDFEEMADKSKYTPGQHFVLDQEAAKIIRKEKIKTYIIGPKIENLSKILENKKFTGTLVEG